MVPVENTEGPNLLNQKGREAETDGSCGASGGRHPACAGVPWLVLSEIFPGGIRGRAMALTSSMNWGINLLISLTFLTVTDLIGLSWVCFIYTVMSLTSLAFVVLFIPETKGCSLEQISMELSKANYVKNNICFMSHHQEELVPTQLQKTKPQEQLPECKKLCGRGQSQRPSPET